MSFTVSGKTDLAAMVSKLKGLKIPIEKGMSQSGDYWVSAIREGMEKTRKRSDGRSEPYNFPAIQSGMLYSSFSYKMHGWSAVEVGTSVEYAKYLEEGTNKMLPRPFLHTQFDLLSLREIFQSFIRNEIEQYMKQ